MKNGTHRFMSWVCFILAVVSSLMPEKYLAFGYYKTFVFLILLAILLAIWDIADSIREERQ